MNERTFEIFRAGTHTTSLGEVLTFKELDLDRMANVYNAINGSATKRAPLVVGHPKHEADVDHYGHVESLTRQGLSLVARAKVAPPLIGAVRSGALKNRSAAFFAPHHKGNPAPGAYFLRHVGFLGAEPPSVKGMAPLAFAEHESVMFSEHSPPWDEDDELTFSKGVAVDEARMALHRKAKDLSRRESIGYVDAVYRLVQR